MNTSNTNGLLKMAPPLPHATTSTDRKRKASTGDAKSKKGNIKKDAKKMFRAVHFTMLKSLYAAPSGGDHDEQEQSTDANGEHRLGACFQSISNFLSNRNDLQSICSQARYLGEVEEEALQEQKRHRSSSSADGSGSSSASNKHGDKSSSSTGDDSDRQVLGSNFPLRALGSPIRGATGAEYSIHMPSRYRSTRESTWNFTANVIKMQRKLANDSNAKVVRPYKALLDSVSKELDILKSIDVKAGGDEEKEAEVQAKIELWQCLYDTLNGTFAFDEET
mmetsp:Transcript_27972/g.41237  ORF Transcript_27972/g.41237 Transcript_27972/m.41237 type:complete len:278 (-) Transcript_27972:2458-3291(-)